VVKDEKKRVSKQGMVERVVSDAQERLLELREQETEEVSR
jgi:hypothetical protein